MQVTAALVEGARDPFRLETLELADPGADELIVRVVASGICQTDVHGRDDYFGIPFPCVFGHEGAGVVEQTGSAVTKVRRGDRVVMVSPSCGSCAACRRGLPGYCAAARKIKFSGRLRDGREPFRRGSTSVFGAFFQQSSFATHALATEGNVVRLPDGLPLEVAAAFACGLNTGVGAVLNVLKPQPGSSVAVFGAGSVGLAAVMAARIAGCATIFAVDLHDNRLELARELGATHVSREKPPQLFDFTLEAAGSPQALRDAVDCLAPLGTCCLVGSARKGTEARLEMAQLQHGRTVRGCIQGDAPPDEFFPRLFEHWRAGKLPVEQLIAYYDLAEVNRAVADSLSGKTVKPVLRIS
ncbi:MAG TPA: NAD(P)-dependent alcohol dehydrogenase [Burkholderiales bacterium]|nr:NAD(P)-dependent alcohol dehydrogenase [Burkholderiales bacterium]